MDNINIFSTNWDWEATDAEMELGGIRIGPINPLGMPIADGVNEPDDEKTLQQEENRLRQKLEWQLKQMKDREANGREYLLKHGIIPKLDIPEGSGVYVRY